MTDFERKIRRLFNFAPNDTELLIEWIVELHEQDITDKEDYERYWNDLGMRMGWKQ